MAVIAKYRGEICDFIESNEDEMKPFLSYTADNNNDDNYENDCAMELAVQNSRFTEHLRKMRLVDEVEGVWSNHPWQPTLRYKQQVWCLASVFIIFTKLFRRVSFDYIILLVMRVTVKSVFSTMANIMIASFRKLPTQL